MKYLKIVVVLMLMVWSLGARAELRIFACEPEWAALATELGQDLVTAYSATTALQDPHYIQARPSLIAKLRRADIVICSGAQLEIGWLPLLLQKANNRKVMPGSVGYLEASSFVATLDATADLDRAKGDIHPQGNPHIQINPHNIALIAKALAARMAKLDVKNAPTYEAALLDFLTRWSAAISVWEEKAAPLKGKRVITHHKSWVYLEQWLGLVEMANLEEIPGIPPTAGHLSTLVTGFSNNEADFIVRSPYQDAHASNWLAKRTGLPEVLLPLTVGGTAEATNLFTMFDDIIARLLTAAS